MPTPHPLDRPEDARSMERYSVVGLVCMAVLIVAFPLYRAGEASRLEAADAAMADGNIRAGRELYGLHCAGCHGPEGRGGLFAPTLAAKEFLEAVSARQLHWLIAAGIPGTTMPAYDIDHGGPLTTQDVHRLVAFLKAQEENAPSVPGWRKGQAAPAPVDAAHVDAAPVDAASVDAASVDAAPIDAAPANAAPVDAAPTDAGPDAAPADAGKAGAPTTLNPGVAAVAKITYGTYCAACHGKAGEGTPIAGQIHPPLGALATDLDALKAKIAKGVGGTAMMAFGKQNGGALDDAAIDGLARWLQQALE